MMDGFKRIVEIRFVDPETEVGRALLSCVDNILVAGERDFCALLEPRDILFVENGAFVVTEEAADTRRLVFLLRENDLLVNVFETNKTGLQLRLRPSGVALVSILRYRKMQALKKYNGEVGVIYLRLFEDVIRVQTALKRIFLRERARGRYEAMMRKFPELFNIFRLKDIACFLGMSPVSLSRLRRQ